MPVGEWTGYYGSNGSLTEVPGWKSYYWAIIFGGLIEKGDTEGDIIRSVFRLMIKLTIFHYYLVNNPFPTAQVSADGYAKLLPFNF